MARKIIKKQKDLPLGASNGKQENGMPFDDLIKRINKNVKGTSVDILSKSDIADISHWVSSPIYNLNRILTGDLHKGLPEKTLTLLAGPEASFKSSFMALIMASAQKDGYLPIIIDTEGAWTKEFFERWGGDAENALFIYEPFVDSVMSILGQLLDPKDTNKYIICVDSVGNLESDKLMSDALDGDVKADQGQLQKKIKRMLKLLLAVSKKKSSITIIGGHYYGKPGSYANVPDEIGGGYHMRLAPHIIISLKKGKLIDEESKSVIGNRITALTLKNRFYPAFQECTIEIDYTKGVDSLSGMVELGIKAGLISQAGAWFTNTITDEKFQGLKNASKCINKEMIEKLNEFVKTTGYSTINKEAEQEVKNIEELNKETKDESI